MTSHSWISYVYRINTNYPNLSHKVNCKITTQVLTHLRSVNQKQTWKINSLHSEELKQSKHLPLTLILKKKKNPNIFTFLCFCVCMCVCVWSLLNGDGLSDEWNFIFFFFFCNFSVVVVYLRYWRGKLTFFTKII